jgi:hypothetical protein
LSYLDKQTPISPKSSQPLDRSADSIALDGSQWQVPSTVLRIVSFNSYFSTVAAMRIPQEIADAIIDSFARRDIRKYALAGLDRAEPVI